MNILLCGATGFVGRALMRALQAEGHHVLPGVSHTTAMLQDRHGDLWLGTENQGLYRIGSHGVERLPNSRQMQNGRITSLMEDAEGSIWAGGNGGLYRLRETLFTSYTTRDGLSGDYVRAVIEDDLVLDERFGEVTARPPSSRSIMPPPSLPPSTPTPPGR